MIRWAPEGSGWSAGDRVMAFIWDGSYAEAVAVPVRSLVAIPDDMGFDVAAGLVVNHHTVHFALARRGHLQPGENVLVMGAGGGIGSAAVQVAKGLGARVIAGVAGEHESTVAKESGADAALEHVRISITPNGELKFSGNRIFWANFTIEVPQLKYREILFP